MEKQPPCLETKTVIFFLIPDPIQFLMKRGPFSLVEEVIQYSLTIELHQLSKLKILGLLEIYIQLLFHLSESRLATGNLEEYLIRSLDKNVRTYILPNLKLVEKELCFLSQRVSDVTRFKVIQ